MSDTWDWLTIEEAAAYAGVKLRTIRTWVEEKRVTYYKPSRDLMFLKEDIDAAIQRTKSEAES